MFFNACWYALGVEVDVLFDYGWYAFVICVRDYGFGLGFG